MTNLVEGSMIAEYYDDPKNHDVIFIGDCEVYANFSPMVMYEQELRNNLFGNLMEF